MSVSTKFRHYLFSAVASLSSPDPKTGDGVAADAASALKDFVADLGVDESVRQQLIGIEQTINKGLVDLGPYMARMVIGSTPQRLLAKQDCSIYDAKPSAQQLERSGALVFVKYYMDATEVVRRPVVEFVGYGQDVQSAWKRAEKMPQISSAGEGQFQPQKSYMLWYQFKAGKIESGKIEFPFYLAIVKSGK